MSPFRDLVKVVFTSSLFDAGLSRAATADTSAVRAQLEKHLRRQLTEDEGGRLQGLVTRVLLEVFPRSLWEDTYVDVLSKHVSVEDARELLAFYGTPPGQKTLRLAGILAAEADDASQRILKARENEFRQRFIAEFQKEFPGLNAGVSALQSQPAPPPSPATSFWYYCANSRTVCAAVPHRLAEGRSADTPVARSAAQTSEASDGRRTSRTLTGVRMILAAEEVAMRRKAGCRESQSS